MIPSPRLYAEDLYNILQLLNIFSKETQDNFSMTVYQTFNMEGVKSVKNPEDRSDLYPLPKGATVVKAIKRVYVNVGNYRA